MFNVTQETIDLFSKNYRQTAEITFRGLDETFTITESDIMQGGLTVDRYSVSGSSIEIGSVCASELSLTLDNRDGKFDDVRFEGAELFVRIGIEKYDARKWENATKQYVDLGYFTIDEPVRHLEIIKLSALDRMVQFDKEVDWDKVAPFTAGSSNRIFTLFELYEIICSENCANVPCKDIREMVDITDFEITLPLSDTITYRQLLQWIAELTTTCAFIDAEGYLQLKWYSETDPAITITPSDRYSSDMLENDITITGVVIIDVDEESNRNKYISGDEGYAFLIEGNNIIKNDYSTRVRYLYEANPISNFKNFTYRPYECVTKPMPYLFPLDMIDYVDKKGVTHKTIVTNVTYTMNGTTIIKGQGETAVSKGYATANPLTKQESVIINNASKNNETTVTKDIKALLAFNDLIANSLGVYTTVETKADGSMVYYMHDSPKLETSNTIYTRTAKGFAYTNSGWNNGNPAWESGFSKDGNIIAKKVNAYGVEVSDPYSKHTSTITPGVFSVWYGAMQILTINGDKSLFSKLKSEEVECGKIKMLPHIENGNTIGTNIIFIDD